jgi:hypothetical protein
MEYTLYTPAELTETVNSLKRIENGLLNAFFPTVRTSTAEVIAFDIDETKRYLAPFVHPRSPARVKPVRGLRTNTFRPAYIKMITPIDPSRPLTRVMGEALAGTMEPQARLAQIIGEEFGDHVAYIDRRMEMMALSALKDAKITVTGEDYPAVELDFGRDVSLNIANNTLTGTARWNQSGSKPIVNIRGWNQKLVKASGSRLAHLVMDSNAFDDFISNAEVAKQFNAINIDPGKITINYASGEGLALQGMLGTVAVWTYDTWFIDETDGNQEKLSLEGGHVLCIGQVDGTQEYGAIQDFKAGLTAQPMFAKMWEEENPSALNLLTQSAPLVVPRRVNAVLCAKVRNDS